MTINDFNQLCAKECVDPAIALENENVKKVIRQTRGWNAVKRQIAVAAALAVNF